MNFNARPIHIHVLVLALGLLVACASVPTSRETLGADTPRTLPSGASFVAPGGWTLGTYGEALLLAPPEADGSQLALVEVQGGDADAAVAAAWKKSGIRLKWPLQNVVDRSPGDGWEQRRDYSYEVPANAHRDVTARVLRRGGTWTVLLTEFDTGLYDKRASQVNVVTGRLWASGYQRESFAGRRAHPLDAQRLAKLNELITEGMKLYDIPALSYGIVQDGKVVFAGGIGPREVGKPAQVDEHTNYIIASNSKQLTTLLLAKLVDQGRFKWDTPVVQLMPDFALGNAETTRKVLVEHLVCACTGLPRQDAEWLFEFQDSTAATTFKTLATMQPTSDFGALYQYSNQLAAGAGYVGAHVAHPEMELGAAYDKAMQELVFDPLGMKDTTFDFDKALTGNFAVPYGADPDAGMALANLVSNRAGVPIRPSAGAWSNVSDMLRFLQMELDGGLLPDGSRYISEAALTERRKPKVAMDLDTAYGMGQRLDTSTGVNVVMHSGDLNGYDSHTFFLPQHRVGVVLLTSWAEGLVLAAPLRRRVLELLFDGNETALPALRANAAAWRAEKMAERKRLVWPADPAEAVQLAPRYRNASLGPITVSRQGSETIFDFGEWKSPMASRRNDDGTLGFVTTSPGMAGHQFVMLPPGPDGLRRLVKRTQQQEYVFEEVR